jgi:hypothetical protein
MPDIGFDPRHYTTPRRDTTPGAIYVEDDRPRWVIPVVILAMLLLAAAVVATDCGDVWCW